MIFHQPILFYVAIVLLAIILDLVWVFKLKRPSSRRGTNPAGQTGSKVIALEHPKRIPTPPSGSDNKGFVRTFSLAPVLSQAGQWLKRILATPGTWPFGLTIIIYLISRFWSLDHFPIYFFSDEAIQTVLASNLVNSFFFDATGRFLPTFFLNVDKYNLGFTVYLQIIPYLLFGKSVIATRGMSVLITLFGVAAVCLIMKNIFKSRYWWSAGLFLSITPVWFLHSRTAFEATAMASFYAMFLYCYMMYRNGSPRYLYAAIVFGGLSFYSYSPGEVVVVVTGLLMLLCDWRYHWQQRATGTKALFLLTLIVLPYIRYLIEQPGESVAHLEDLGSYWTLSISLVEKVGRYFSNYFFGLNPAYLYLPNHYDLERHIMKGYGHFLLATAPLALIGLGAVLSHLRSPGHRIVLIALLAAPTGAALVQIGMPRILVIVMPIALLTAMGLTFCLDWLARKSKIDNILALASFLLLAFVNIYMTADALRNGPLWFQDYGLYGMQYGSEQVFGTIKIYLQGHPNTTVIVSPDWANNVPAINDFFIPDHSSTAIASIDYHIDEYHPIDPDSIFVMTPPEFERTTNSHKFKDIRVEEVLNFPNGQPGFYFVRLQYADNIRELLAEDSAARHSLQKGTVMVDGRSIPIQFSQLDGGSIQNVFDGNPNTLVRTKAINPFVLDLSFPIERKIREVTLRIGGEHTRIIVQAMEDGGAKSVTYSQDISPANQPRDVSIDFGRDILTNRLVVMVRDLDEG
jgi:hypothetical protein